MGLSSSKSTTKSNSTSTENATTTPIIEPWVREGVQGWAGQVGNFGKANPYSFVAPASPLQTRAFEGVDALGGWQPGNQTAQSLATQVAGAPPTSAAFQTYNAPTIARTQLGQAALMSTQGYDPSLMSTRGYTPQTMEAAQAETRGYDPFMSGPAGQASLTTFSAPQLGPANTYQAAQARAVLAGPAAQAQAQQASASRGSEFMGDYMNPYQQQVVDAYLADFDETAGRTRAAQSAAGARNRAFGDNRFGIREAITEGELARARASGLGNILTQGFQFAGQMGASDADRLTSTSGLNAQLGTQTSQFNAGERNLTERTNAQLGTSTNVANAGFTNDANRFNAGEQNRFALTQGEMEAAARAQNANAANQVGMFNVGQANEGLFRNQDAANRAVEFGANAFNTGSVANAGFRQQAGLANLDAANRAAEFGANWANVADQTNTTARNQAAEFGANWANVAGQNNTQAQNQFALSQFGADTTRAAAQAGLEADASQFGANAFNSNNQFNAQLREAALGRQLQAAGLMGDLSNNAAANQRADLSLTADLGNQQWQLEQLRQQSPLEYMRLMAGLQGSIPYGLFTGQNISGTTNSSGTSVQKTNPGLGGILGGLAGSALSGWASGGFALSDPRLKRNVERIGTLDSGVGWYSFCYLWDDAKHEGVMADEVAEIMPEALGPEIGGFATVDYNKVLGEA